MINKSALTTLNSMINRLIALDPDMPSRLQQFNGETLKVQFTNIPLSFFVCLDDQGVTLLWETNEQVDTTIKGSFWSLGALAIPSTKQGSKLFSGDVEIKGNLEFGQAIKKTFDQLDIDWEEALSTVVGDVAAHHISRALADVNSYRRSISKSFRENIRDFLQHEQHLSPCQNECDDFYSDITVLTDDVARISARVSRLCSTLEKNHS